MGLLRALRLVSISERFNSTRKLLKKKKKSHLKTVNHHSDGRYTSFKPACQRLPADGGYGFESP